MSRLFAPQMISAATSRQGRSRLFTRSHDFAGWQSTTTSRFRETAELVADACCRGVGGVQPLLLPWATSTAWACGGGHFPGPGFGEGLSRPEPCKR